MNGSALTPRSSLMVMPRRISRHTSARPRQEAVATSLRSAFTAAPTTFGCKPRSASGKNRTSDAVWAGPYECGSIFNAITDWQHLVRESKNRAKIIWNCKNCYGDWMGKKRTGQWAVMLYYWDRVLSLVLERLSTGVT